MESIRSFIAIDLPAEVRRQIESILQGLKRQPGVPVRWIPVSNVHITLKFLGEVPASRLQNIIRALEDEALHHAQFQVEIGSLGVFPNLKHPRIVWLGATSQGELPRLAGGIETACFKLGFPREDRPFSPHLTIGRVQQGASSDSLRLIGDLISRTIVGILGTIQVEQVSLFRSELKPGGAVYTLLKHIPLVVASKMMC